MSSGAAAVWKNLPIAQRWMILLLIGAIAAAQINQPFPELAPLQHGPTLVLALSAPWLLRRCPLSNGAFACIFLFLLLHTLGGRYIYSHVPYDDWAIGLTGYDLSSTFGWTRNGYDRLVHFAFGLLLTYPLAQIARRHGGFTFGWSLAFGFVTIGFISALYESFEWLLTLFAEGDTADWYNGQQGDIWDPQKDMVAAQAGAFIALLVLRMCQRRQAGAKTISTSATQQENDDDRP
jgi:putative membrane protein